MSELVTQPPQPPPPPLSPLSQAGAAPATESHTGFNLSSWTLRHQPLVVFLLVLITFFGITSYNKLAQSEDPPFTFKVMVVRTVWPGATARQVQEEITDRIARKLQESPDVDFLRSYSRPGESTLFFTIKDAVAPSHVPGHLVPGAQESRGTSLIRCPPEYRGLSSTTNSATSTSTCMPWRGMAIHRAQLHDYAERLRTELLRVPDVNKVDFIADQDQRVHVEISNAELAKQGLTPQQIADAVNGQNAVAAAGVSSPPVPTGSMCGPRANSTRWKNWPIRCCVSTAVPCGWATSRAFLAVTTIRPRRPCVMAARPCSASA